MAVKLRRNRESTGRLYCTTTNQCNESVTCLLTDLYWTTLPPWRHCCKVLMAPINLNWLHSNRYVSTADRHETVENSRPAIFTAHLRHIKEYARSKRIHGCHTSHSFSYILSTGRKYERILECHMCSNVGPWVSSLNGNIETLYWRIGTKSCRVNFS